MSAALSIIFYFFLGFVHYRYMLSKLKVKFILWLMKTFAYRFFLKYIIPNLTLFTATGPTYFFKQRLREKMKPGDVLLSKSSGHLTNVLIGGTYSHAAFVVDTDKIAEMTANGFDIVDVDKFCKQTTRVCLLRLKEEDDAYGILMAKKAMEFADAQYDLDFSLGVEALYCSELAYQCDYEKRFKCDLSDLAGIGRPYISPVGLYRAEGLKVITEWTDKDFFTKHADEWIKKVVEGSTNLKLFSTSFRPEQG